ncbi:MAG TPA: peptidoglycan-binding domain-containing protein [Terriglobia bacterium]|nr:peptidoglycan-binding domain-containing protein [Terriglobia bacterium]
MKLLARTLTHREVYPERSRRAVPPLPKGEGHDPYFFSDPPEKELVPVPFSALSLWERVAEGRVRGQAGLLLPWHFGANLRHKVLARILLIAAVAVCGLTLIPAARANTKDSEADSIHWNRQNIEKAQKELSDKGYYKGKIDGVMGPQTHSAIRQYQKAQGVAATGRLDAKTAESLGVWPGTGKGNFKQASSSVKRGGKSFGHEIAEGKPADAGKDLGKAIGHAGKEVGKGVKKAVTHH